MEDVWGWEDDLWLRETTYTILCGGQRSRLRYLCFKARNYTKEWLSLVQTVHAEQNHLNILSILTLDSRFLAAKARLTMYTCPASVCLSISKLNSSPCLHKFTCVYILYILRKLSGRNWWYWLASMILVSAPGPLGLIGVLMFWIGLEWVGDWEMFWDQGFGSRAWQKSICPDIHISW